MPTPPAPAPVRLRLVFVNHHILRRAQREDGLRRCWLLLRPELATVADLAAHVAARFRLRRSCPRGVALSMDGFSLPPFESTCIFRDKDIIRVKQKASKKIVQRNDVHCIQDPEIVEKRPLPIDDEILAIEYQKDDIKHQEEEVQCDHQCEENATANRNLEIVDISSKREWRGGDAGMPESSKRKKLKVTNPGKHIGCSREDSVHQDRVQYGSKMLKRSSIDIEAKKTAIQAEATVTLDEEQKTERNNQTELNCDTEVAGHNAQSDSKKVSRSARRKKLKRQLRQKAKEQLKEMDGFSLPPFESTCTFRDKDIIRVKQKASKKIVQRNDVHCIQDPEIVEKRPLPIDDEILAIEYQKDDIKHQEEEVQCDHQCEENATANRNLEIVDISSKREWRGGDAGMPESSKRKKLKVTNPGKHVGCSREDSVHQDRVQYGSKMLKRSSIDIEAKKTAIQAEATVTLDEEQKTERNNQTELNCDTEVAGHNAQSDSKKVSRSARRKKLKRQLRQKAKEQLKENVHCQESPTAAVCPSSSNQDGLPSPSNNQNDSHLPFSSHKSDEEESDTSGEEESDTSGEEESDTADDIVPVVVRPGHIRFEPAGGEPDKSPAKEIQATFQWSGTVSKKKGQKWGMSHSNKKSTDISHYGGITGSNTEVNHHVVDSKTAENGFCGVINQKVGESSHDGSASEKTVAEEGKSSNEPLDFESMYPLTRHPKEGDLIVYRLVELSSSWCPELSSYRVGKVLIYDPISMRIILLPVPEYPIIAEEKKGEDQSDMLEDMSHYKEDGSLEIEYSSLLDVRLLKGNESVPADVSNPFRETGKKGGSLVRKPVTLDKNKGKIHSQTGPLVPNNTKDPETTPEKTKNKVWEESGEASNDKPEVQENGWGTWTPNASTSAWTYRALRSSALGPTVAFLRGKNSKRGKPSNRKYSK